MQQYERGMYTCYTGMLTYCSNATTAWSILLNYGKYQQAKNATGVTAKFVLAKARVRAYDRCWRQRHDAAFQQLPCDASWSESQSGVWLEVGVLAGEGSI